MCETHRTGQRQPYQKTYTHSARKISSGSGEVKYVKTKRNLLQICPLVALLLVLRVVVQAQAAGTNPNPLSFTMRFDNQYFHYFNATTGTGRFLVLSGTPSYETVIVRYSPSGRFVPLSMEDIKNTVWTPFDGIIRMNFGPTDGVYDVELGLKGADPNVGARW